MYDSPELVRAYRVDGKYPAIHRPIFDFALKHLQGRSVLDLCSSTGLLGRHFADLGQGWQVCAVEASGESIARGVYDELTDGPQIDVLRLKITDHSLDRLVGFMRQHQVDAVIARRAIYLLVGVRRLSEALLAGGAREIVLQGLVRSPRLKNVALEGEIMHLSQDYRTVDMAKPELAYLVQAPDLCVECGEPHHNGVRCDFYFKPDRTSYASIDIAARTG
jgi:SAM-dependent methyltransferase